MDVLDCKKRVCLVALIVVVADQVTKLIVLKSLGYAEQRIIINGVFKFVHWGNTGAAWSLFYGNNGLLALVSVLALFALYWNRHYFELRRPLGQVALGLMAGGIVGNLLDRVFIGHVVDFLRFYIQRRSGLEIGFPAFNVADSAICVGVSLIFILSLRREQAPSSARSA